MIKPLFVLTILSIFLVGMTGCATQDFQDYPDPITQINSGFYSNVPSNTSVTIIENRPLVVPNNNYPYYDDPYYNPNNPNYNQATPNARAPTPLRPGSNYRNPNYYYRNQNNSNRNNSNNQNN